MKLVTAPPERLVWFVHFHKAGGTSVVELAKANGERLFPGHRNGNPIDESGEYVDFEAIGRDGLRCFVDDCLASGVSFIASEWSTPDLRVLAADSRLHLVAAMREPLARYVSNYNFDYYLGYNHAESLECYEKGSTRSICKDNYYCNTLLGRHFNPPTLDGEDAACSISLLDLFDTLIVLERPESWESLGQLGWTMRRLERNQFKPGWRNVLGAWRRPRLLLRRLSFRKATPTVRFAEAFRTRNRFDLALYEAALARIDAGIEA